MAAAAQTPSAARARGLTPAREWPHITERELATATADVECKRKHETVRVWWGVRAEMQRADVERNKATYEAVRRDLDTVRANIRRALDE
ncbi:hypothetical protein [Streptomyces sp. NPDC029004]|uniref:hypothetical protein n=1 Tax=Streptomyces sp. NPDC029004 TaxID=3154490 RepID=UPI0033E21653